MISSCYRRSLVVISVIVFISGTAFAGWQTMKQLTATPNNSNLPDHGNGFSVHNEYVHIAYSDKDDGGNYKVFYLRSTDRGGTWSQRFELDERSQAYMFTIVADNSGNVHFINRHTDGALYYRRSTDNGANWLPVTHLADHTENPILLTNGAKNVYAIDPIAPSVDAAPLYITRSTNGGESWEAPMLITTQESYIGLCAAADDQNRLHIAFAYGPQGNSKVYYIRSTDNGSTWGGVSEVVSTAGSGSRGIWADRTDHVFLSFTIYTKPQNYCCSTDGGSSWEGLQSLPCVIRDIAVSSNNTPHAVAVQEDNRILYAPSVTRGLTWNDTARISTLDPGVRSKPLIEADEVPNLHAVWNGRQTGKVQLYYRKCTDPIGIEDNPMLSMLGRERKVKLSPNPVDVTVNLHSSSPVALFDKSGAKVAVLRPGKNDVSLLRTGVYFAWSEYTGQPVKLVKLQ
ncbi:hypothetical protein CH330_00265 [candidate division WOR-3 bacterium JGI_Cruoil_03_51_56]|uniref:Sialidase domain-containing protein n=1 Tax=candidate division WOR-3 bacterium JGI_Cruoil_03_51_56 TaxID=1973747 RepID=A0A235BYH8_UNCW3|nr:MAG: hypothetical protein CH330_00265 [candidate division WOR-3 bacterium JGI_Cruoil_03_51_56]